MGDRDTLPKILLDNYLKYGDKSIALYKKQFGIWQEYTWKDYYDNVKYLCLGLISLGFEQGEVVAIVGDTDPQWFWGEIAAQAAGGIAVGLFTDGLPSELKHVVTHAGAKFILAKDQEQVDKILEFKAEVPELRKIIYWEDKGLWNYDEPLLMSFEQVQELGKKFEELHPGLFEEKMQKGKGDDIAILSYTSGTTGVPRGIAISHRALLYFSERAKALNEPIKDAEYIATTSPAWIWEQWQGVASGLNLTMKVNFPEEPETVQEDIREVGPSFLLLGPRQLESLSSMIQVKISDTSFWKRFLYNQGIGLGYRMYRYYQEGRKPSWLDKVLFPLADWAVLEPLRDKLGISRVKFLITGSASLSPDIFAFFQAMGATVRTTYGSTEANTVTLTEPRDYSFGTVGVPLPDCQVRISEEGELLVKSDYIFHGYHRDPETTEARLKNGWFHSGDAGTFDSEGRLIFWDRLAELAELSSGAKFSPQYVETRLRFSPYIMDAFVTGKGRDYVCAMININFDNVAKWMERRNLPFTTLVDMSQKKEARDLIKQEVQAINQRLPEAAKVKKFANLHKGFDADEAELTRTRKLRRTFMEERYKGLIEAMYQDREAFRVEAAVTYRDGRKGLVTADIKVNELELEESK